ncbi:MAG: hypothetical protein M1814_006032 [Vezdaea aestivalis]|nr:MAG: hypothetical protein M1814_006032 [Vezdaea aestivalis]
MSVLQQKAQKASEDYQRLQSELQMAAQGRQKLEAQQQENSNEFAGLEEDASIYKLVGPVLLKQDRNEAAMAVDGRLDYIDKEIKRVEKQIVEIQAKSEDKKMEIIQMQTEMQQIGDGAAPPS